MSNSKIAKQVFAFDFDGTLTTNDTFVEFIRYVFGTRRMLLGFLRHSPLLVLMKLGLYPNYKAKQRIFSYFFKGMTLDEFDDLCFLFAQNCRYLLRMNGEDTLKMALSDGADVVIISASIENWVLPWFSGVAVVGTKVEVIDSRLTGRFLTPNCYGREKVRRLLELYPNREEYHLTAFGDSRGDRELLAFSDEKHYKPFR